MQIIQLVAVVIAYSSFVVVAAASDKVQDASCTNFGEWACDVTGKKLLQCAYANSHSLTWYWSGATCCLTPPDNSALLPGSAPAAPNPQPPAPPKPSPTKRKPKATKKPVKPSPTPVQPQPQPEPQPEPQPDPAPVPPPPVPAPQPNPAPEQIPEPIPVPPSPQPEPIPQPPTPPPPTTNPNVLISGSGDGSYYYDFTGRTCPHEQSYPENNGYTSCEPSAPPYMTLGQHQDNFIVALALDQMNANKANLCGKRVIVKYNGIEVSGSFVVWDSCAACTGGVRLDFSLSALLAINPDACFKGVVPGISWEVTDEQVIPYYP
ncbi:hypothetical protein BDR26DRAFT_915248 [Obelidium mucronatum]|nr:hypothetical protein BDR26DRAFT_915248 [Obelidium mucronatum]